MDLRAWSVYLRAWNTTQITPAYQQLAGIPRRVVCLSTQTILPWLTGIRKRGAKTVIFLFTYCSIQSPLQLIGLNIINMKYRIDAYINGTVRQGTILLDNIDAAIKKAKEVAAYHKCYTKIARVAQWVIFAFIMIV